MIAFTLYFSTLTSQSHPLYWHLLYPKMPRMKVLKGICLQKNLLLIPHHCWWPPHLSMFICGLYIALSHRNQSGNRPLPWSPLQLTERTDMVHVHTGECEEAELALKVSAVRPSPETNMNWATSRRRYRTSLKSEWGLSPSSVSWPESKREGAGELPGNGTVLKWNHGGKDRGFQQSYDPFLNKEKKLWGSRTSGT